MLEVISNLVSDIKITDVALVAFTGFLWWSTRRLWLETKRLAEASNQQSTDMRDSIAQAGRSATAMEGVAESMAANVETIKTSVEINREIADRQKLITELQTRAYLSVSFGSVVEQNAAGLRYEPKMLLINNGNTPAYNVRYRAAADVLPFPLPAGFGFPLNHGAPVTSAGMLGPRQNFIISAIVPNMVHARDVAEITTGVTKRLYIWGIIEYQDCFQIDRVVRFSQWILFLGSGQYMALNTAGHNDAT